MTVILTNDDGIDAPGIRALQAALPGQATAIVAPDRPLSGCSHQLSRGQTLAIDPRGPGEYAIGGTPADCTRVAVGHLYPQAQWLLSGINAGGNLGADVYVSGTVAAVREATLLRIPAIALSHYIHRGRPIDWAVATRLTAKVLAKLMATPPRPGCFWNVNLPHLGADDPEPPMVECPLCTQPLPTEFQADTTWFRYGGDYSQRPRDAGADVAVCFGGAIALTQICLW